MLDTWPLLVASEVGYRMHVLLDTDRKRGHRRVSLESKTTEVWESLDKTSFSRWGPLSLEPSHLRQCFRP
jgi:hypothetical protein